MAEGNRKDPRARVLNMTVRYKSATVDEFIENHSHDISRGGIFIKTRAPFPAGTLLKFEVRIAEDQRLMQGVGRVVWRREPERAEEGFPAGMGIKFIKTGEGASELISQIVAARQGEESSFDAGARENGADSGSRRSLPPQEQPSPEVAAISDPASPALQVESAPASAVPVEGEIRVSSPPKKRAPPLPERKVVLQGAAVEAPTSDKTPISTREVSAQAAQERSPSRSTRPARERSSLVDETTAPRARAITGNSARAEAQKQSNPSIYGLVAILGVVALTVLFVQLVRKPEPEPVPPAPLPPAASTAPVAAPPAPEAPPPTIAERGMESGEGAEPSAGTEPERDEATPSAAPAPGSAGAPARPAGAAAPAPGGANVAAQPPAAAPKPAPGVVSPGVVSPSGASPSGASPGGTAPTAVPAPAVKPPPAPAAKPPAAVAPATPPRAVPKPPAPAPAPPPAATRPAPPAPAPEVAPAAPSGSAGAPTDSKRPPAATAPSEPAPAPKPALPPAPAAPAPKPGGDDNPY